MAKRPDAETAQEPEVTVAPKPMSLQEAASTLRPRRRDAEAFLRASDAVEAILAAEGQAAAIERRKAEAQAALDKLAEDRKLADEGLTLARQGLVGVQDATRAAREELATAQQKIKEEQAAETRRQAEARKAWDAERAAVDKEIAAKQAQLDAVRRELAEVVKRHAPAAA